MTTYPILRPFGWLYGKIMQERNRRFDIGRKRVENFPVPILSVGNLSVGGTGKTPMCIYLLKFLQSQSLRPALLSRGYGRKTKGFFQASALSSAREVGDEPLEIFYECGCPVFVCEKRCLGARRMLKKNKEIESIVLDDAFQHRYIGRDINILLTDFERLYSRDRVLPEGRLRERREGAKRADIIVVTKCPATLSRAQADEIAKELNLESRQHLFFASIGYQGLEAAFSQADWLTHGTNADAPILSLEKLNILVFTGIAKPQPLIDYFQKQGRSLRALRFSDHHVFSSNDIERILSAANETDLVITTAKDLARLPAEIPLKLRKKLLVQRIGVKFLFDQESAFQNTIKNLLEASKQKK